VKNQLLYLLSEGFRGFKSSKDGVLASIFTIGICTSVLGILLMMLSAFLTKINNQNIDNSLRIFVLQNWESQDSLSLIKSELNRVPFIDSLVFISKEAALQEFKLDFNSEMVETLQSNPLPPSWILYPGRYYESHSRSRVLRDKLKMISGVEEVSEISPLLQWMDKWKLPVYAASIFCLLFVSIALSMIISNAVKLNLFTRKVLVDNMKYCGAAESFIVIPFLVEGLLLGTIGSLIGILFCLMFYFFADLFLPGLISVSLPKFILFVFLITSVLTAYSSFKTVKKFIHVI